MNTTAPWHPAQKEILALLKAVPLTMRELVEIRGAHPPPTWQSLTRLEEHGYVIRYGRVRYKNGQAALWHWTGKPFPEPPITLELSALQVQALSLPQQLARVGFAETIAQRPEGAPRCD